VLSTGKAKNGSTIANKYGGNDIITTNKKISYTNALIDHKNQYVIDCW
jgi:hypothetical protein